MHAVMRYTVRADQLQSHLDLLRDVYDDLADTRPGGIAWTTYQVTGTRTFVEFVEGPDLPEPCPADVLPAVPRRPGRPLRRRPRVPRTATGRHIPSRHIAGRLDRTVTHVARRPC